MNPVSRTSRPTLELPALAPVRQVFRSPALEDAAQAVRAQLRRFGLSSRELSGRSVAITAGSRGIRDLAIILRTLVEELRGCGARPFLVPAMGSHGGATSQGQAALLEDLGVSEAAVGAPIRSSMEVLQVGTASLGPGLPLWLDRLAAEADHLIVVNRIKAHTDFSGAVQSGLLKMLLVGLGKQRGAEEYHRAFRRYGFQRVLQEAGTLLAQRLRLLCGLAIVENHRHQTALIEVVEPGLFAERERELLRLAERWTPRLPFDRIDLLVVDRMGKDISGSGMDTNVIGRKGWVTGEFNEQRPRIERVYVRDLTDASHGNAVGIGLADFAHSRLIGKIDSQATYLNAVTSGTPRGASLPPHFPSDLQALQAALNSLGEPDAHRIRLVRIRSTLELERMLVSEAMLEEARFNAELQVEGAAEPMRFNDSGDLWDF